MEREIKVGQIWRDSARKLFESLAEIAHDMLATYTPVLSAPDIKVEEAPRGWTPEPGDVIEVIKATPKPPRYKAFRIKRLEE